MINRPFSFRIPVRIPVEIMQRNIERPIRPMDGRSLFGGGIGWKLMLTSDPTLRRKRTDFPSSKLNWPGISHCKQWEIPGQFNGK